MKFKVIAVLILVLLVVGAAAYGWWWFDARWRPKTVTKHQAEIASLLDKAGWVSPGGGQGKPVYVIAFRSCPDCVRYWEQEVPKLRAAGADVRMVLVARRDENGQERSTAVERATVAELWVNRRWSLLEQWQAAPLDSWTAAGIAPADGDAARGAVIELGRQIVERITPMLADNGVAFAYPTVIWWNKEGQMRACRCEAPQAYRYVRKEVGA